MGAPRGRVLRPSGRGLLAPDRRHIAPLAFGGTRVVTATLSAKWIEVVVVSQNGIILAVFGFVFVVLLATASIMVVQQYQRGVHFRLGRVIGVREPGLRIIVPSSINCGRYRCGSSRCRFSRKGSSPGTM